tara:strand:- start:9703 stop:11634 length:1932 start_codon:yes stop_codon:yes gene_type:complete
MTLKKYTIKVTDSTDWEEFHHLLCDESSEENVPNRCVVCWDDKLHSPTRGTFLLHGNEVNKLKNHPKVEWVELSPQDNPDSYPKPSPATYRWGKNVKIYRDLDNFGPPASSPTSVELDRTNWGTKRVAISTNGDFWTTTGNGSGDYASLTTDLTYDMDGRNVDIVIHDSGVLQYHPEFLDENGQSRVRDIILDGPYFIDPDYFINNNYTYIKADGRIGITTASAIDWWENGNSRSSQFLLIGTISVNNVSYTERNALGDSLDGSNGMTSGHGTACAALSAGKNFGCAFKANIWNMPGISDAVGMDIETNYDAIKIFHKYKQANPVTGRKNPTIINGSWGYQAAFGSSDTVNYKFRGSTGSFTGNASVTDQVTAMKEGLSNQVLGAYKSWSSSSRSNSTDTAANEMMSEGVIYVAAAGNNNQRLGIGTDDPDRLNYMEDDYFNVGDPRSEFPGNATPCNHRDWMNPQGIGFDENVDPEFHPVICVGAMDDNAYNNDTSLESKASYSNNGSGIDVWAPADETLSAGTNGVSSYEDFQRYDDTRFYDCRFNGTSAAAPVATGVLALYLQSNPTATSREVKDWLKNYGSKVTTDYQDSQPDDTQTTYWTFSFTLRGAEKRIIFNPFTNNTPVTIDGLNMSGVTFNQI